MDVSDDLLCLFNARVREQNGSFVIEVPQREVTLGDVEESETHRVALLSPATGEQGASTPETQPDVKVTQRRTGPPVEEGDIRDVEIEDIGDQGDGITRIGPGYIVFVPGADIGDRVTIELTDVRENFAFGEVIQGRK